MNYIPISLTRLKKKKRIRQRRLQPSSCGGSFCIRRWGRPIVGRSCVRRRGCLWRFYRGDCFKSVSYIVFPLTSREGGIPEIVGHDDDTTVKRVDGIRKTVDGRNIETVGRLVQKQHVGRLNSEQCKDDTTLLTLG